jgi:hypothetical protein
MTSHLAIARLSFSGRPVASRSRRPYQALNRRISEYTDDLVEESIRVAGRRHSPEIVSASDVERAIDHLGIRPRRRQAQGIGSIGALLLGAAIGNVLQIAGMPTVTPESTVLTFVCGVAGASMMVYGYLRD